MFASGIYPERSANSINLEEANKIVLASARIIKKAMELGGTTIRSYTSSLGVTGHYQDYLCVHKQEGCPCKNCKSPIVRIKVGGRSTYYCPECHHSIDIATGRETPRDRGFFYCPHCGAKMEKGKSL